MEKYKGTWSLDYTVVDGADGPERSKRKCFEWGPFCGKQLLTDIFHNDDRVLSRITPAKARTAVNFWGKQKTMCILDMARDDSPCVDAKTWNPVAAFDDCNNYKTGEQQQHCRDAATAYCDSVCPTKSVCVPGPDGKDACRAQFLDEA